MVNPLKTLVLERDHSSCQRLVEDGRRCGRAERLTMHHLVPRRMGGRDELDNIVTWCHECHRKHNKSEHAQKRKLHDLRKTCKWTVDWKCRPTSVKCQECRTYCCANWPEGFLEALCRLLSGMWNEGPVRNG